MEFARRLLSAFLICTYLSVFVYTPVSIAADPVANNMMCGQDLNNNGYLGDEGEYTSCLMSNVTKTSAATASCPSGYVPVGSGCQRYSYTSPSQTCPSGYYIQNGRCINQQQIQATATCRAKETLTTYNGYSTNYQTVPACSYMGNEWGANNPRVLLYSPINMPGQQQMVMYYLKPDYLCSSGTLSGSVCVVNQDAGPVQLVCPSGYSSVNGQCQKTESTGFNYSCASGNLQGTNCVLTVKDNYCPIGANQTCLNNGGGGSCSPNKCVDITKNEPVDEGNVDGTQLVDDGKKSEDGVCLDQIYIFNGRASDCKLAGVSTAYKNCCKSEGKVYSDDVGPYATVLQAASTVKNVYAAAQEAYLYYTVAMTATADTAIAGSMAASAFADALMASMNPATIAIAIAIHFIMEYLMKACDQMSMETAMEAASGMCHEVGTYCKKKVPLLGCVQKATSYCCYNSILARIIQEQGRPQLTTFNGWGKPESPQCRGFTPEEFQQLDFSKINLDEYVQTMVTAATSEIQDSVKTITESFYDKTN